jgi:hypothetical protein
MIEIRQATVDEMVLAFLQAEVDSPTERGQFFANGLTDLRADRRTLIDQGNLNDLHENALRAALLSIRGYRHDKALFTNFPADTTWRLVTVTPAEVMKFKYANDAVAKQPVWARLAPTRLVADGVKNLDQVQNAVIKDNVTGTVARVHRGRKLPALIAVQHSGVGGVVLMEGHTRATAYALAGLPEEIEVIIGTSARMNKWLFF